MMFGAVDQLIDESFRDGFWAGVFWYVTVPVTVASAASFKAGCLVRKIARKFKSEKPKLLEYKPERQNRISYINELKIPDRRPMTIEEMGSVSDDVLENSTEVFTDIDLRTFLRGAE